MDALRKSIDVYSPNTRWGKQHVEIVLQLWAYRRAFVMKVGGNRVGFNVMDAAIEALVDELFDAQQEGGAPVTIVLTDPDGKSFLCEYEDSDGDEEDWIKSMVVSARIVDYEPPTLNEVRAMNGAPPVEGGDVPHYPL